MLSMLLYAKKMKLDLCQKGEKEMLINELKQSLFASSVLIYKMMKTSPNPWILQLLNEHS